MSRVIKLDPQNCACNSCNHRDLHFQYLSHLPYWPDLAPSHFNLIGLLKETWGGKTFRSTKICSRWCVTSDTTERIFFYTGIHALYMLFRLRRTCIERNGDNVAK